MGDRERKKGGKVKNAAERVNRGPSDMKRSEGE